MMLSAELFLPWLGPASILLSLVLVILIIQVSRQLSRTRGELGRLRNEYLALSSGNIGIGKKLLKLEGFLASLSRGRKQTPTSKHNPGTATASKENQSSSVSMASGRKITRAEAELIRLMQNSSKGKT